MAIQKQTQTLTEHALRNSVTAGTFEPAYYLYGDDDFRKEEAVAHLVASAVPATVRDFNVEIRRGSELDPESVTALLDTPPLMADRRAVVIRDVGALKKEARRLLDKYLNAPARDTVVVLTTPAGAKADAGLSAHAVAVEFPALTGERVPKWIAHRTKELDAAITPEAAELLFEAVGNDLASLAGELDKLVSYVRGSVEYAKENRREWVIDEAAVSAIVGVRRGETLGDLLDRVALRDAPGALALLPHVLALPKTTAVSIVMALTTQTLALAWGVARRAQGVSLNRLPTEYFNLLREAGSGAMTGRPWGQAVSAWTKAVEGWTLSELDRALEALLAADMGLKDTRVSSDEQLLTSLVLTLCQERKPRDKTARGRAAGMVVVALLMVVSGRVTAQSAMTPPPTNPPSPAVDSAIHRAQSLVGEGNVSAGRGLIDSLLSATTAGTPEYAEVLYTRASIAPTADAAEHDYRQLTVEYPASPRATISLLRLAQLELTGGQHEAAVSHLERLTREFSPTQPSDARTEYEMAQAYLELKDITHACTALASAQSVAASTDVELLTRVKYALERCPKTPPPPGPSFKPTKPTPVSPVAQPPATPPAPASLPTVVPTPVVAPPPPPPSSPSPSPAVLPSTKHSASGKYTVQVAAYDLKSQANALVAKLLARGDTARVWGTAAPFRVRIGHYPTWAAADVERKALIARHIDAFVTETEP